jgi:glucose-1-phosphate thymidylyltransferase
MRRSQPAFNSRVVGVVPAAGRALRLQPLPCSKEALVIAGRPLIDHLLLRLRRGGCEEIVVVTRAEKHDVVRLAREAGARVLLGEPATAAASLALGASEFEREQLVLFGFPDTLWEPEDGFCRLLAAWHPGLDAVLGLFRTSELTRSDVVVVDTSGGVRSVVAKPAAPASDVIWGCGVATAGFVAAFGHSDEPAASLDRAAQAGRIHGVHLSDSWLDVGTPQALHQARGRHA